VHFIRWYLNSAMITVSYMVLSLFFSSMGGFGFAKYDFRFRGPLFAILLGSMMIPFYVILIPLFVMMVRIQWVDTYQALVIPFSAGAFGIFLMRQYMVTLPTELMDAARIDGASEFRIFLQIFLPLSRPALATLAILNFMGSWNSFLWPLIILRSPEKFTLPLGMANLLGTWMGERLWGPVMAGAFLTALPILILFVLMQKQLIAGMTLGAIRG
jgi:ABC-type glycerol-3-phosphate transport system permease component